MMWLLITTLCIVTGPGRAECRIEVTSDLLAREAVGIAMEVLL